MFAGVHEERNRASEGIGVALLCRFFLGSVLIVLLGASGAWAASSVNVPLGHWSYRALDKLSGFGLLQSDLKGTRPFARLEAARLIKEAMVSRKQDSAKLPSLVDELLAKLEKEYARELEILNGGTGAQDSYLKPIDEISATYVYSQGEPHDFSLHRFGNARIEAGEGTPLLYNNEGLVYGENHNALLRFSTLMQYRDWFSASIEPYLLVSENSGEREDVGETEVDLLKGYGKLSRWNVEFEGGRDSMWWGQGRHGSLLLTNNATPLDILKLSNPSPSLLPWYFKYLGPFKYTLFLSKLEDHRIVDQSLNLNTVSDVGMGGMRLNFKPHPFFEMGMATTFIFGGDGRPDFGLDDFFKIIGFQEDSPSKAANQIAAFDFRFHMPWVWDAELYAEYGGEDSGSGRPEETLFRDLGYLVGIYLPRLTPNGRLDLRLEYAHNAYKKDEDHSGFWYGHFIYRSGYTHDQLIMGHHMGPDAEDLFVRATYDVCDGMVVGLDYDYMARGENNPRIVDVEELNEIGADLSWDIYGNVSLNARYAFRAVDNFNFQEGVDREDHFLTTGIKYEF